MMLMAPQGRGRVRTYFVYPRAAGLRPLSGGAHAGEFLAACRSTGAPDEWFSEARVAGPLAQFSGADQWVDHPARNWIVLIGDAAAASDPSWGSGLSVTLLDVLTLSSCLTGTDDRQLAIHRYAEEHDRYYAALHAPETWYANLFWAPGTAANQRRAALIPRLRTEPGMPDIVGLGPASAVDEHGRTLWSASGGRASAEFM